MQEGTVFIFKYSIQSGSSKRFQAHHDSRGKVRSFWYGYYVSGVKQHPGCDFCYRSSVFDALKK